MLAALLLAACGGPAGRTSQEQAVDGVTITLDQPQKLAILQDYEFVVTLTDAAGKPIDGAAVYLDQDMPAMPMGVNQPLGDPLGSGRYRIRGVFTMEGQWRVTVHARVAGKEHAATFTQQVTPQS